MTKNILFPIFLTAAIILALGLISRKYQGQPFSSTKITNPTSSASEKTKKIKLGQKEIEVEIADTELARTQGLSGRESLAEDKGMLFIFPNRNVTPIFWMKGMKFALDLVWIKDNKIIKIDKNVPPPETNTADSLLPRYTVNEPVDYVLEVNGGFCQKNQIKEGETVDLSSLKDENK